MAYPADLFAGAARYYARYRVPYPEALIDHLLGEAGTTDESRVLDLACGTGEVALPISAHVAEVWAVDQEPEMVALGREKAAEIGAENLTWIVGRAEDLVAPAQAFDLVTVGSAFHRLDRRVIAERATAWLRPGRCLAVVGSNSVWTGEEAWQKIAVDVIRKSARREPGATRKRIDMAGQSHREALAAYGFRNIDEAHFRVDVTWTLDSFVGYLYSTSVASKAALGDGAEAFEAELRRALLAHDPRGVYREAVLFHCITARP